MKQGDNTTNTNESQSIIREYFKNLYSNKLTNLEETDKFLYAYGLPKLNKEGTKYLNRSTINNKIKAVIKGLPTKMNPGPDDSLPNSTRP
jgi:hypothetical protein